MTTNIENHVEISDMIKLDSEVIKKFMAMDSRQFAEYLIDGGNHQQEIEYYLRKIVDQNYANEVLENIREKYRQDIITGHLKFWKFA